MLPSKFKALMGLENPLVIRPEMAKKIGLNNSIVLEQLHYWLRNNQHKEDCIIGGEVWSYCTIKQWKESNFIWWSEKTIERIFSDLIKLDLVKKDKLNNNKQIQTNWYTINYENFKDMLEKDDDSSIRQSVLLKQSDCIIEKVKLTECIYEETKEETKEEIQHFSTENVFHSQPEPSSLLVIDNQEVPQSQFSTIDSISIPKTPDQKLAKKSPTNDSQKTRMNLRQVLEGKINTWKNFEISFEELHDLAVSYMNGKKYQGQNVFFDKNKLLSILDKCKKNYIDNHTDELINSSDKELASFPKKSLTARPKSTLGDWFERDKWFEPTKQTPSSTTTNTPKINSIIDLF